MPPLLVTFSRNVDGGSSAASIKAAVSERDLIEAIKRSGSVAQTAGVSLDELVGVVSAVQERTARGGAVIGNSFKTIFHLDFLYKIFLCRKLIFPLRMYQLILQLLIHRLLEGQKVFED